MTIQALNESGINIVGNKLQADEVKLVKYLDTQLAGDKEKITQAMAQIKGYITMINSRNLPEKGLYNVMNQGGKNSLDQIIGTAKNWLQQRSALSTIQNLPTPVATIQTSPGTTPPTPVTASEPKGNTVTNTIGKGIFGDTMLAMNARSNR